MVIVSFCLLARSARTLSQMLFLLLFRCCSPDLLLLPLFPGRPRASGIAAWRPARMASAARDAALPSERGCAAPHRGLYRSGVDNAWAERSGPPQYQRRNSIRSPRVHAADAAR